MHTSSQLLILTIRTLVCNPVGIYLFKVNDGYTRTMCEICSKLTIKTPERRHDVFLVSLLLTFNKFHTLFLCFHCWLWTRKYWLRKPRVIHKHYRKELLFDAITYALPLVERIFIFQKGIAPMNVCISTTFSPRTILK